MNVLQGCLCATTVASTGLLDVYTTTFAVEVYFAVNKSKDGEITAKTNTKTWLPFGAALTDDDVTGNHFLTTEFLYA